MFKEFKEFALKGNIMDMAIGVIIGGAFQKIVTSLVSDIIMPAIGLVAGKVDFSELSVTVGSASIAYGKFITAIIDFLIIALSIFIVFKVATTFNKKMAALAKEQLTKTKRKFTNEKGEEIEEEITVPETKLCPHCYTEINYLATRCPHCTSELEKVTENK